MDLLKAVILGTVQGLTEFLPISSSGHLVIGSHLLGFTEPGITFDIFLHLGSLLAVLWVFRQELHAMAAAPLAWLRAPAGERRVEGALAMDLYIVLATLPAVVVGLLFKDRIEEAFTSLSLTFAMLAVTGLLMVLTRWLPRGRGAIGPGRALAMGVAQSLAILPGISRSGSTIFTGMALGMEREAAARFSFLMSIPAILGAVVLQTGDLLAHPPGGRQVLVIACGAGAAAVSGYLAIVLLLRVIRRGGLHWFGYYCLALSATGFLWHLAAA